jgi:U3 small nucleolar RNA-associated protein 11
MQRLMMGKGARRKIQGREKAEDEESLDEDEDALDARGGRALKSRGKTVDNETWKPRVYKWKLERKR